MIGLPFVAAIAWSRRKLDRHTWPEIVVGMGVGGAAAWVAGTYRAFRIDVSDLVEDPVSVFHLLPSYSMVKVCPFPKTMFDYGGLVMLASEKSL